MPYLDQVSYAKQGVIVNNFSVLANVWRVLNQQPFCGNKAARHLLGEEIG